MNTIGKVMSTAILASALTAMSPGPLWAQTTDTAPAENTIIERKHSTELVVKNNNWLDAHVYAVRGGMRTSLGVMTSLGKRTFELPAWTTLPGDEFQILVHLIGGGSYVTPVLSVHPGDVVQVEVQNNVDLSTAVVFRAG